MIVVQTNTPNKQCGTILISSKRNVSRAILPESPGGIKHVEGGGGGVKLMGHQLVETGRNSTQIRPLPLFNSWSSTPYVLKQHPPVVLTRPTVAIWILSLVVAGHE